MFRKILVANDGSDGAKKALEAAIDLAIRYQAELHTVSVEEPLPRYAALMGEVIDAKQTADAYYGKVAKEAEQAAIARGVTLTAHVLSGQTSPEGSEVGPILALVTQQGFDLLVMGFVGHSQIFGLIWGSTSQNLARLSPCTVMLVK